MLQSDCRTTADFESLVFFVQRFETLKLKLEGSMDQLYDKYQALDGSALTSYSHIDHLWQSLGNLQGCNCLWFNLLLHPPPS